MTGRPKPGSQETRCPDLLPSRNGTPWKDALGRPYQCELGIGHGGSIHAGGGTTWAPYSAGDRVREALHDGEDVEVVRERLGDLILRVADLLDDGLSPDREV